MLMVILCVLFGFCGFIFFPYRPIKEKNLKGSIIFTILFLFVTGTSFSYAYYLWGDHKAFQEKPSIVRGVIEDIRSTGKSGSRIVEIGDLQLSGAGGHFKGLTEGETVYIYYLPKSKSVQKVISGDAVQTFDFMLKNAREDIENGQIGTESKVFYENILEQVGDQLDD